MIILTYHAVEQFMSRLKTELSHEAAWEYLERQLPYARKMKQRSLCGDTLWELPNGHFLITKAGNGGDIAVTFLRELRSGPGPGPTEEELEMLIERTVSESPASTAPAGGMARFRVTLTYKLGADNEPIALERIEQALRTAIGALKSRHFAKATVESFLLSLEDKESL